MKIGSRRNGASGTVATLDHVPSPAPLLRPPAGGDAPSLGARLSELLSQETPDSLLERLAEFKASVEDALKRSSSAYQILSQLQSSGLQDCARCTQELETRLAANPHYVVLAKIAEAEHAVRALKATHL